MNTQLQTKNQIVNWILQDRDTRMTIARRAYFARTNLGTKNLKGVHPLATAMVRAGMTREDLV